MMEIKKDDIVTFEFLVEYGWPRWDFDKDMKKSTHTSVSVDAIVLDVEQNSFMIEYVHPTRGSKYTWNFPRDDKHTSKEGWPTLKSKMSKVIAPQTSAVWTESLKVKNLEYISDSIKESIIEKGERGVRRVTRAWPYNSDLIYKTEQKKEGSEYLVTYNWYFQERKEA